MPNLNGPLVVAPPTIVFASSLNPSPKYSRLAGAKGERIVTDFKLRSRREPLRAHSGFPLTPHHRPELIDRLTRPSHLARMAKTAVPQSVIELLCKAQERGARLASIRSGAFVLAAAGLLNGATVTTISAAPTLPCPVMVERTYSDHLWTV